MMVWIYSFKPSSLVTSIGSPYFLTMLASAMLLLLHPPKVIRRIHPALIEDAAVSVDDTLRTS